MEIERKNFNTAISAEPDGTITAVVSVFNNTDRTKEVVKHGAFAKSLERKLPKGVWAHDWKQPVAKTLEAKELAPGDPLLPLSISSMGGLYVKGQFNLDTQAGRDAYSNIKFGIIDEFSIGYVVVKDSYDQKSSVRHLEELDLFEWSPVLVGTNASTQLLSIKSEAPALKLAQHSEAVLATCEEFAVRIKSLRDLRAKEGRSISTTTRGRIQASIDGMTVCIADLTELIAIPEIPIAPPMKAAQEQARHIHAEILRTLSTA